MYFNYDVRKVPHRYVVQGSDTTMMTIASSFGQPKLKAPGALNNTRLYFIRNQRCTLVCNTRQPFATRSKTMIPVQIVCPYNGLSLIHRENASANLSRRPISNFSRCLTFCLIPFLFPQPSFRNFVPAGILVITMAAGNHFFIGQFHPPAVGFSAL